MHDLCPMKSLDQKEQNLLSSKKTHFFDFTVSVWNLLYIIHVANSLLGKNTNCPFLVISVTVWK